MQRVALEHAEAVLLVDHHEAQPLEAHALLDERVRAHREVDVPARHRLAHLALRASPCRRRAHQPHPVAQRARAACGRCARAARRGSPWAPSPPPGSRPGARAAPPPAATAVLPEPTSPWTSRFIGSARPMSSGSSVDDALPARPVSWKGSAPRALSSRWRRHVEGDARLRLHPCALERHAQLEEEQLVEGQAPVGRAQVLVEQLRVRVLRGEVDGAQGRGQAHSSSRARRPAGSGSSRCVRAVRAHHRGQLPEGALIRPLEARVDGDDAAEVDRGAPRDPRRARSPGGSSRGRTARRAPRPRAPGACPAGSAPSARGRR